MPNPIIKVVALENSAIVLLARVTDAAGDIVDQSDVSSLTVKVYNSETRELASSPSAAVADVIFDTLQTDSRWSADAIGYNFALTLTGSNFDAEADHRVEIKVTPASGAPYYIPFDIEIQPLYSE